jgi:hypothetical protein
MTAHANSPIDTPTPRQGQHGSSLGRYTEGLDAERAASMSDEGGASGALVDAVEQAGGAVRDLARRAAGAETRIWPWLLAAGGVGAICAIWMQYRATQSRSYFRR